MNLFKAYFMIINHIKETIKNLPLKILVYFLFPIILIIILYASFFPFGQSYISEWHDLLANSMYYTITSHDYFATWNNLWASGFPLVANPNSDRYYILSAPFYLIFQNLSIVNFIILFHIVIAWFGFWKLGTLVTKNPNLLLIFSTFFAFSGAILGRVYVGHHLLVYGLAWVPLLYYFFLKICIQKEEKITDFVLLSIVSSLLYFTGDIYHFVLVYLILLVFFAYFAFAGKISRKIVYYLILSVFLTSLLVSIKALPDVNISGSLIRNDPIDPLAGGGTIDKIVLAFITGKSIDNIWGDYESSALVGIIPLLFIIPAILWGKREIIIP